MLTPCKDVFSMPYGYYHRLSLGAITRSVRGKFNLKNVIYNGIYVIQISLWYNYNNSKIVISCEYFLQINISIVSLQVVVLSKASICCVFRPAFGCCSHPKADWNTFFQPFLSFFVHFQPFSVISLLNVFLVNFCVYWYFCGLTWKRLKKVVQPAFGCAQHPNAGRNTQHPSSPFVNFDWLRVVVCVPELVLNETRWDWNSFPELAVLEWD